jgi:hypothetical protein
MVDVLLMQALLRVVPDRPSARCKPLVATPDGKEAVGLSACLVPRPSRSDPIDDLSVGACLASAVASPWACGTR